MLWMLLGLLACSGSDEATDDSGSIPPEERVVAPGPYAVGYRTLSLDTVDPLGEPRTLYVAVWYPTDEAPAADGKYRELFPAPNVNTGAPPAATGAFPLVVYSHGHQGYAEASGKLLTHLASHGFVAVAPDHLNNTTFDSSSRPTEIYAQRPVDIQNVMDEALTWAEVDASAPILAFGHSFGGYTLHALAGASYDIATLAPQCYDGSDTTEFCSSMTPELEALFEQGFYEPRIRAYASMAPGDWRLYKDGLADAEAPILHMIGTIDPRGGDNESMWESLDHPGDRHLRVTNGGHQTFTDFSGSSLDPDEVVAPEVADPIVNGYGLAWVLYHHGDETMAPLLDGTPLLSQEATIEAHP